MQLLDTPDELQQAESAFARVFRKAESTEPFQPGIGSRLLLYPVDFVTLDEPYFKAVAKASITIGVETAYLAAYIHPGGTWGDTYGHRLLELRSYEEYRSRPNDDAVILEHFLFAPTAEWGLVTSDGQYAVLGGSVEFVRSVRDTLAYDQEHVVRAFVSDWEEMARIGATVDWVPNLLRHVLGEKTNLG
jgi:hypothetical protein